MSGSPPPSTPSPGGGAGDGSVAVTVERAREAAQASPGSEADQLLPWDPEVVAAVLDNGMRVVVRPHAFPPNRTLAHLVVHAGSLNEANGEEGLAHLVEHLVFLGTEQFPGVESLRGELTELGMAYNADSNAYTSFRETVYTLQAPARLATDSDGSDTDADEGTAGRLLNILHQLTFKATFDPDELDREREVVLSEASYRNSVSQRRSRAMWDQLHWENSLPKRWPIGKIEAIKAFTAAQARGFYKRWYTPRNMTLLVVGVVDAQAVLRKVAQLFRHEGTPYARGYVTPVKAPRAVDAAGDEDWPPLGLHLAPPRDVLAPVGPQLEPLTQPSLLDGAAASSQAFSSSASLVSSSHAGAPSAALLLAGPLAAQNRKHPQKVWGEGDDDDASEDAAPEDAQRSVTEAPGPTSILAITHRFDVQPSERYVVYTHSSLTRLSISITQKRPLVEATSKTFGDFRRECVEGLVADIFSDRINARYRSTGRPPFLGISLGDSASTAEGCITRSLSVVSLPGRWREAFAIAVEEVVRLHRYGVGPEELRFAIATCIKNARDSAEQAESVESDTLLDEIHDAMALGCPSFDRYQELDMLMACSESLTIDAVAERARQMTQFVLDVAAWNDAQEAGSSRAAGASVADSTVHHRSASVVSGAEETVDDPYSAAVSIFVSMPAMAGASEQKGDDADEGGSAPEIPVPAAAAAAAAMPGSGVRARANRTVGAVGAADELPGDDLPVVDADAPEAAPIASSEISEDKLLDVMRVAAADVAAPKDIELPGRLVPDGALRALATLNKPRFVRPRVSMPVGGDSGGAAHASLAAVAPPLPLEVGGAGDRPRAIDPDTGIVCLELSNGITLTYKDTKYEPNCCTVDIVAPGGRLLHGMSCVPGVAGSVPTGATDLGFNTLFSGGAGGFSADTIAHLILLWSIEVNCSASMWSSKVSLDFCTEGDGLDHALQLAHVYLRNGAWEAQAFERTMRDIDVQLQSSPRSMIPLANTTLGRRMYDCDPRMVPVEPSELRAVTIAQLRAIIDAQFTPNNLHIIAVGDLDPLALEDAVLKYFGCLPAERPEPLAGVSLPLRLPLVDVDAMATTDTRVAPLEYQEIKEPGSGSRADAPSLPRHVDGTVVRTSDTESRAILTCCVRGPPRYPRTLFATRSPFYCGGEDASTVATSSGGGGVAWLSGETAAPQPAPALAVVDKKSPPPRAHASSSEGHRGAPSTSLPAQQDADAANTSSSVGGASVGGTGSDDASAASPASRDDSGTAGAEDVPGAAVSVPWSLHGVSYREHPTYANRCATLWVPILSNRMDRRLRQETGACYSASAYRSVAALFDESTITMSANPVPERVGEALALLRAVLREFAEGHFTDEEVTEVRAPLVQQIKSAMETDSMWGSLMTGLQCRVLPKDVSHIVGIAEFYESITREDLEGEVRRWFAATAVSPASSASVVDWPWQTWGVVGVTGLKLEWASLWERSTALLTMGTIPPTAEAGRERQAAAAAAASASTDKQDPAGDAEKGGSDADSGDSSRQRWVVAALAGGVAVGIAIAAARSQRGGGSGLRSAIAGWFGK